MIDMATTTLVQQKGNVEKAKYGAKKRGTFEYNPEHCAHAFSLGLPISMKHSVEISNALRYKNTIYAKRFLEEVCVLKRAVPFHRFTQDMGHKKGMAAGRFPQKAAESFLALMKSVEANAQFKGLSVSDLKIIKIVANKASIPATGGRRRRATKRTNLEIVVCEVKDKKETSKKEVSVQSKSAVTSGASEVARGVKETRNTGTVRKKVVSEVANVAKGEGV